ncbi:MAG: YHS domain-containing protein [Xanthomonadales bacterium]|nr:YHS domain-containing protein [Deltaproteobacteria bacterium]MDZ4731761.1 YHS domain-containing protein [Xanthomonadales bacterium]
MDAESLKSLGWFLIWGGLFFVMMRYGCGAHMMGGHGHSAHKSGSPTNSDTKDPVCGMTVDQPKAAAASVYGGNTYYFCSRSCRDKFDQAPDQYLNSLPQGGHHG